MAARRTLTHSILLACLVSEGIADLPIHCTLKDIAGDWVFQLGPAAPVNGKLPACGHHIPNNVNVALKINRSMIVPPKTAEKVEMTLTEEISTTGLPRHLVARSGKEVGMWTTVFDTGLETRVGDKSMFAHFLFSDLPGGKKGKNGDNFQDIGQYIGRTGKGIGPMGKTYACYCNVVTTGFWHRRTKDGGLEAGCFWGAKKVSLTPNGLLKEGHAPPTALVKLETQNVGAQRKAPIVPASGATNFAASNVATSADFAEKDFQQHGGFFKEVFYPTSRPASAPTAKAATPAAPLPKLVSLRGVAAHAQRANGTEDGEKLPLNFDWRKELAAMVPKGQDPLGEQVDQGPCGSCYAFAGVLMLQMRFRAQFFRKHKILYPLELSFKSPAQCSPYTEGCNGGFSYLTMRLAYEIGVPLAAVDSKKPLGSLDQSCDWASYKDNKELFFAKDYWHVGGFSHGSDEQSIMHEIYHNGPVELGFSTSAVPEFVSRSGQSISNATDTMTIVINDRAPKEPFSTNPKIQPWVFSTHAILGVGWGQEDVKWGMVKYWTVRNSWGRDWGVQGYSKMRRGNNDGGIETDATMAIPDMDRLPAGFLDKAKAYDAGMAAKRAEWKTQKAAPKAVTAKKGTPEYCKQRPDSIDCK